MDRLFTQFANKAATIAGHHLTFVAAVLLIVVWGISGPIFGFSDTWQLVIYTTTTIITFVMVFLIQNTQNRDALAMHVKLDEIIRALNEANDAVITSEDNTQSELEELKKRYAELSRQHAELADAHEALAKQQSNGRKEPNYHTT